MSTEANKDLIRCIDKAINDNDLSALDQYFTPDYVDHSRPGGLEGAKQLFSMFRLAVPDFSITIEDMVAEGEKVVVRFTLRGTHQGELMGVPATSKQLSMTGIDINRIANGRLAERWANQDDLGMLQQLGVIPPMG
jgi:steroid delta-isomerase-like uncharacterized protein